MGCVRDRSPRRNSLGLRADIYINIDTTVSATYGATLHKDPAATLDDLREAATTLEEVERTARRVLGGTNPFVMGVEHEVEASRAALRRDGYWREETAPGDVSSLREAMEAMMSGDAK